MKMPTSPGREPWSGGWFDRLMGKVLRGMVDGWFRNPKELPVIYGKSMKHGGYFAISTG